MTRFAPSLLPVLLLAAACAPQQKADQPFGAPDPVHSQMVFVDLDGCRWWVIGNAVERTWAPQTDTKGQQVCDAEAAAAGDPIDLVDTPQVPQEAAQPSEVAMTPAPEPTALPEATAAPVALTAPIAVVPEPAAPAQPAANPAEGATLFIVQVATFANRQNAAAAANNFSTLGLPLANNSTTAGSDGFYRLELGPFAASSNAQSALERARAEGYADAFVRRR